MLSVLFKRLLIASDGAELITLAFHKTPARVARFDYTFFGEDRLLKGGVILAKEINTYSNFSLTTFGLVPATSPEGVFWQEASGEVVINFKVSFAEGEEVDSLKGTLTLLDGLFNKEQGKWIACVRSSGHEVAKAKGTWSRRKV